jgi:hypothetical protein
MTGWPILLRVLCGDGGPIFMYSGHSRLLPLTETGWPSHRLGVIVDASRDPMYYRRDPRRSCLRHAGIPS